MYFLLFILSCCLTTNIYLLSKAMKHSNVVINLVGRDWETKNFKFEDVNVAGARRIARIARECGVKRLVHFSSLNIAEHLEVSLKYLYTTHGYGLDF